MSSGRIVIDQKICHGKPVIAGTRIMVTNVLSLFAGGYTTKRVIEYYPELTEEDVAAAVQYAIAVLAEEDVFSFNDAPLESHSLMTA